jgi:hypothetical protein
MVNPEDNQQFPSDGDPTQGEARETVLSQDCGLHPILGRMIGNRAVEAAEQALDTHESLISLETKYRAVKFLEDWYSPPELTDLERALGPLNSRRVHPVDGINNQFASKLVPCFSEPDTERALADFREIVPNTINEEMILLTNDQQFADLHQALAEHLVNIQDEIVASVEENKRNIKTSDLLQFRGRGNRSLDAMREGGMVIAIDPMHADQIHQGYAEADGGVLPLTEHVKNGKILGVNSFMGSKIAVAAHDYMDHFWGFDMIDKAGILDRYAYMFDSIGNPESTDIYRREGEIVASIGFGVRYFQTMPAGFGPVFRASRIESLLDEYFVEGKLEGRHMEAYRTLKGMRKGSMEWSSLGFSFSNYITELDEQRRKFGTIKQRDPRTKKQLGELDPMSPDFICFFIDTHQQVMSSKHKHRDDLFRFHIALEEYLVAFAQSQIPQDEPLVIRPAELREVNFRDTTLPPKRLQWMRNNLGFTATRDVIV